MNSKQLVIITFENDQRRHFVDETEIKQATFEDFRNCDWDYNMMGLYNEGENEDGESIFSEHDFEGQLTWEELKKIEIKDWYAIKYWNGQNWKTDLFESYYTQEIKIEELNPPSPTYYFSYILTLEDEEKVLCFKSNMSGLCTPYYIENIEE